MNRVIPIVVFVAFAFSSTVAHADFITINTVPIGLSPGDHYYLAFLTNGTHDAVSDDINVYDAFVNAEADSSPSQAVRDITWRALGSTSTVSARDHLQIGNYPIYLLDGINEVASGGTDLWDGSIDAPILIDQLGNDPDIIDPIFVLTGTSPDGRMDGTFGGPSNSNVTLGSATYWWNWYGQTPPYEPFRAAWVSLGYVLPSDSTRFYAFSELLTVPGGTPVPEPASLVYLTGIGGCALVYGMRRRARKRLSRPA